MEDRQTTKHSNVKKVVLRKPLRQSDARKRYRKRIELPQNAMQFVQQSMTVLASQLKELVSSAVDEKLCRLQPQQQSNETAFLQDPDAASSAQTSISALMTQQLKELVIVAIDEKLSTIQSVQQPTTPAKPPDDPLAIWLESVELKEEIVEDVPASNVARHQMQTNEIVEIIDVDHDYAMKSPSKSVEMGLEKDHDYAIKTSAPREEVDDELSCDQDRSLDLCNPEENALRFGFVDASRAEGDQSEACIVEEYKKEVLKKHPLEDDTALHPLIKYTLGRRCKKAAAPAPADSESSDDTECYEQDASSDNESSTPCKPPPKPRAKRPFLIADPAESVPYKYISGARLGSTLLYTIDERQLYRRKVVYPDRSKFRCAVPTCSASIYMYGTVLRRLPKYRPHNHGDQEQRMRRNAFLAACKLECKRAGGTSSLPQIYANLVEKIPSAGISLQTVRQTLRHWKGRPRSRRQYNPRPDVVPDVDEVLPYSFTVGARAGSTMLYSTSEKQLYRLKNQMPNRKRYVCRSPSCLAALYLHDDGGLRRSPGFVPHNHEPQDRTALRIMFAHACRKECQETGRDPREVYDQLVEKFPLGGQQIEFEHMRRHLARLSQKRRNELHPQAVAGGRPKTPPLIADPAEHLPYRMTPGGRMGSQLVYSLAEKQLYRLKVDNAKGNQFYACRVLNCPAVVHLRDGALRRQPRYRPHNHGDQEEVVRKFEFAHACRVECARPGTRSARQVYNAMLVKYSMDSATVPYESLKKQLIRYVRSRTATSVAVDAGQLSEEEQLDGEEEQPDGEEEMPNGEEQPDGEEEQTDGEEQHEADVEQSLQNYCFEEFVEDEAMGLVLYEPDCEECTNASVPDDAGGGWLTTGATLLIGANEELA